MKMMKKKYLSRIILGFIAVFFVFSGLFYLEKSGIFGPEKKEALGEEIVSEVPYPSANSYGYYLMPYKRFDDEENFPEYTAQEVLDFWINSHDLLIGPFEIEDVELTAPGRLTFKASNASWADCYSYTDDQIKWGALLELYNWLQENWQNYAWSSQFSTFDEAFEDCWVHITEDTTFTFTYGDSLAIPAYDPASPNLSRLPGPWARDSDWILNVKSEVYRSFWQDYYALEMAQDADGIFLDVQMFARPGFDFNKVREFSSKEEFEFELAELTAIIKNTVNQTYPEKLIAGNTYDYFEDYLENGDPLKFLHEDSLDVQVREGSIRYIKAAERIEKEAGATQRIGESGKIVTMQHSTSFSTSANCQDGLEVCLARDRIAGLAGYYLAKNENVYFFSHYDPANDPYSCWFEAIAYDIGEPVGNYYVFAEGDDPSSSATYKVLAREYTKGLVLLKPRPDWNPTVYNVTSATSHELSGTYRSLKTDGTLSDPITSITLRNWEGAILIEQDTTPPAAINDLEAL